MSVLSMNSKRQRRPNVRLGEIGDVSASLACSFSQKSKENFGPKSWKYDSLTPKESKLNPICGVSREISSNFTNLDLGVSPRISTVSQQNTENKNPNSSKPVVDSSNQINMNKLKLDFSNITRKCRVMKRRGRSRISHNNILAGTWISKISPEFSCEEGQACGGKEVVPFTSNVRNKNSTDNSFKDITDQETTGTSSKAACEYDVHGPTCDTREQVNFHDGWKEDSGEGAFPISDNVWDEMRCGDNEAYSVPRWLEDLGFGKYTALFEMHEVDEEVLPLLTLEDLKEMGVFSLGPRHKLFNAIQQLKGGDISG
ncbi:Sterile alpha motif domain [Quillaja saponaria]|uniref:Sterile alpha motif domain n=1 Tax=Quillaja saponaria TaxID=32244 RepID=A0AAD7PI69_QUISA|nr:Sterile alpha motif domain [Quillaja saponaria]